MFGLFKSKSKPEPLTHAPDLGEGRRVYAIGDIHGRLDLLLELIDLIAADDHSRGPTGSTQLVFLGDYVDRGQDSKGVIDYVLQLRDWWPNILCLRGNHEEVFAMAVEGDESALRFLTRIGGRETLLSYGTSETDLDTMTLGELRDWLTSAVPDTHRAFLAGLTDKAIIGNYAFVHAGVRPEVPLDEQDEKDLRWIREEFLFYDEPHDYFIVHGHSITEAVEQRENRMGIDTGAYKSGVLTAAGLEGTERWFLSTGKSGG
ncbi:serine/threonine protein phosphatase 1 [Sphingobium sp. B1D7B]|uniref:metallophosphoesterase family protein n=1 Tax=unclassified Sphingobium TaxID=2611147 RepID=UPI0022248397|nr:MULTISPECIES: metallophosphoesterase family protein [unclassified Sphingobium]MCW2368525.1 serine/threonine protein phosphatase 1 [Sphingobium sp. B11D3D]MCW2403538.1 serine/threonine protein phosphatase 1 [Sphingobium sp. B1D7B]